MMPQKNIDESIGVMCFGCVIPTEKVNLGFNVGNSLSTHPLLKACNLDVRIKIKILPIKQM